jgi:hypothetical protein
MSEFRQPHDVDEAKPELLFGASHNDPHVGCLECLKWNKRRMRRVMRASGDEVAVEVPGCGVRQHSDRGVEKTEVTVHSGAVATRRVNAAKHRNRSDQPGRIVDHREARLRRRSRRLACQVHPSRYPLQEVVVPGLVAAGPGHAEPGQGAAHDAFVQVLEVRVRDSKLCGYVAAQIGIHDVADAHEVLEHGAAARGGQIEVDAAFVPIEGFEEETVLPFLHRWDVSPDVSTGRRVLDLDDVGAEIRELHAAERPSRVLLDGNDANVREGPHAGV